MPASRQDGDIGKNIRRLRQAAKLTQEELAARMQVAGCDVSRGTLAKIEAGIRHLYADEIRCLKAVLNVEYQDILK